MKKNPDILSLEQWKQLWNPIELDSIDDLDNDLDNELDGESSGSVSCPSCDGDGTITLDNSYQDVHGAWQTDEYDVECMYCHGYGIIDLDSDDICDYTIEKLYNQQVKRDLEAYKKYYEMVNS
jgi:RecJ-like exonuclease